MVIMLCDWWKYHEYVCCERVLGFIVETKLIYEWLLLGSHSLIHYVMKDRDQVGSKEVFYLGECLDSSKQCPELGYFTGQTCYCPIPTQHHQG